MCGFTGFIGETKNASVVLEQMMNRIVHRGPDSSEVFIENEAAIGFQHLHILDIVASRQQIYTEDEEYVLIINGAIYNLQELKDDLLSKGHVFKTEMDSEVVVNGYKEYGEKIVGKIRGMFAFVLWNRKSKKLFAARDMFGIKPFYYAHMNGTLFFGSEIKSFMPHNNFTKELNKNALKPYLTFEYSVLNETFFKGVFKLPAAHYLIYEKGEVIVQRYWSPKFNPADRPLEDIVEEIDSVIKESIRAHQVNDVKIGSFLSSGVDSSYIVSVLKPHQTFTVGFSNEDFSEIDNAKALSNELGILNSSVVLDPDNCFDKLEDIQYMMDEPHSNPSIVPLYFLAELASRDVKVIYSGEGADELFGGYEWYDSPKIMKRYKKLPSSVRKSLGMLSKRLPAVKGKRFLIKGGLSPEEWFIGQAKIFEEKEASSLVKSAYNQGPTIQEIVKPYYDEVKNEDNVTKMQYLDLHLWLTDHILLKADKMSMAHSIEIRVPFLDREVIKVATKVPTKYRIHDEGTKYALRVAAKRELPKEYANRKKIGFPVPIHYWIQEEKYYKKIKVYFESDEAAEFFNRETIIGLLNNHYKGKAKNGRKIWTIFMFLVWYKRHFT